MYDSNYSINLHSSNFSLGCLTLTNFIVKSYHVHCWTRQVVSLRNLLVCMTQKEKLEKNWTVRKWHSRWRRQDFAKRGVDSSNFIIARCIWFCRFVFFVCLLCAMYERNSHISNKIKRLHGSLSLKNSKVCSHIILYKYRVECMHIVEVLSVLGLRWKAETYFSKLLWQASL